MRYTLKKPRFVYYVYRNEVLFAGPYDNSGAAKSVAKRKSRYGGEFEVREYALEHVSTAALVKGEWRTLEGAP